MKLLSHERLASLQEQLDYLERLFKYTSDEYTMANPNAASPRHVGICAAQAVFDRIGLNESVERIKLEIAFLEDFLEVDLVDVESTVSENYDFFDAIATYLGHSNFAITNVCHLGDSRSVVGTNEGTFHCSSHVESGVIKMTVTELDEDSAWLKAATEARAEGYATETETAEFLRSAMKK
jgi:hypothetical protein